MKEYRIIISVKDVKQMIKFYSEYDLTKQDIVNNMQVLRRKEKDDDVVDKLKNMFGIN